MRFESFRIVGHQIGKPAFLPQNATEHELQPLVDAWRAANPHIVQFWWNVDHCVKEAIRKRTETETNGIRFLCKAGMLFIMLPSGRRLSYVQPRIGHNKFGGESITYKGFDTTKKWNRIESYGPKFVENIVQTVSRDLLCFTMQNLSDHHIVGHVHDELIIECPKETTVESITSVMSRTQTGCQTSRSSETDMRMPTIGRTDSSVDNFCNIATIKI